jgi:site-specific DNA recombinase
VKQKEQSDSKIPDRELLQRHVERVPVHTNTLEIIFRDNEDGADAGAPTCLSIPFTPNLARKKGITHAPADQETMDSETRDSFLRAIARSRGWLDSILSGEVASFDELATAEALAERHVRFLIPLAFLSPGIVGAIANGTAPIGLTVSGLARALPHKWVGQERMFGLS